MLVCPLEDDAAVSVARFVKRLILASPEQYEPLGLEPASLLQSSDEGVADPSTKRPASTQRDCRFLEGGPKLIREL